MKKDVLREFLEREYKNMIEVTRNGNIAYCNYCNKPLSENKKQFFRHVGKHLIEREKKLN